MQSWSAPAVPSLPGRGLPLRIHDTATGTVHPVTPGEVATLYVCGITPYDAAHLGHAATYVAFDTLQRVWRDGGHEVRYVQNVTDIDDPLLERATRDGVDWAALAVEQTDLYRTDMAALRVLPPDHLVGAVEAMDEIAERVQQLLAEGYAYELDGDVYYSVDTAERFGAVAGLDTATMLALSAERGGDPERPGKKNALDPLLWMSQRPGEPGWSSPLGVGRPGWHIECVAMALNRLGETIDVNGGGSDLAFPHHEMGAAHATSLTGTWPFARAFVHTGMVGLDGEKMSKSKGNLVFVHRLREQGRDPAAVRLAILDHHYRSDWPWTAEGLAAAEARLRAWRSAVTRPDGPDAEPLLEQVRVALADDLDTPRALRALDRWAALSGRGEGADTTAPELVRRMVDALLGVAL